MVYNLLIPAFIAGLLTFLAPCTLPLVPGYIAFISGTATREALLHPAAALRKKIFYNGIAYVLGFSIIFIFLGLFFGLFGSFFSSARTFITYAGGILALFFGLYLMGLDRLFIFRFLQNDKRFHITQKLRPGEPLSCFALGACFAFGWSPCIGPILGTILTLASTAGTAHSGALLLGIFSLGLAIPFILTSLLFGHMLTSIKKISAYTHALSFIGGLFLVFIGVLILTNNQSVWNQLLFLFFDPMRYDIILEYL